MGKEKKMSTSGLKNVPWESQLIVREDFTQTKGEKKKPKGPSLENFSIKQRAQGVINKGGGRGNIL